MDARSADRFNGKVEEPREGLRSGHIPNSKSLPYTELIDGNKLKSDDELTSIFNNFNVSRKKLDFFLWFRYNGMYFGIRCRHCRT